MEIGVNLSKEDLQAIVKLYKVRWSANIRNWKEREVDECLWVVSCPDKHGNWIVETGQSLAQTIEILLKKAKEGLDVKD